MSSEFVHEYERERARTLRRRALWYCFVVLAILSLSVGMTIVELATGDTTDTPTGIALGALGDAILVLIHVAGAMFLMYGPVVRRRVVVIISWMIALTGAAVVLQTQVSDNSTVFSQATTAGTDEAVMAQCLATLLAVFLLHFIASILVTLSPREGLRPLVPLLLVFALSVLIQTSASLGVRLFLVGLSPLAGLPGLLFSWWRHRSFSERFTARAIARKYEEVTNDLAEARRLHESLFPDPVEDRPIRMRHAYEPARHIGGDFLFVKVVRRADSSCLAAVLIDVTGHGVPAALAVNRLHGELTRLFAHADDAKDGRDAPAPDFVIAALNTFACDSLAPQRVYATALCVEITVREGEDDAIVRWSSAGHPAAILRRGDGRIENLAATASILGALPPDVFGAGVSEAAFARRDVLIAVTDGAIESRDIEGNQIGADGLASIVASRPGDGSFADAIVDALAARRPGLPADDTLVVEFQLV